MVPGSKLAEAARAAWAAPCSLLGLLLALPLLAMGARAGRVAGTLEVAFDEIAAVPVKLARWPFCAITFGHVILGATHAQLDQVRRHERVHVRQYGRWGVVFLLAYPLSSMLQLLRGKDPYWHNRFEVEARALDESASGGPPA